MFSAVLAASVILLIGPLEYLLRHFIPAYLLALNLNDQCLTCSTYLRSSYSYYGVQFLFFLLLSYRNLRASNFKKRRSFVKKIFFRVAHCYYFFISKNVTNSLILVFEMALRAIRSQLKDLSSFSIQEVDILAASVTKLNWKYFTFFWNALLDFWVLR